MTRNEAILHSLRQVSGEWQTPLTIALDSGRRLELHRLLRVLPGKRVTAAGEVDGKPVLAKLFFAKRGSTRHWERECQGIQSLIRAGIPTPGLIAAGGLTEGGHYLLTEFISESQTLAQLLADRNDAVLSAPTFTLLGHMHSHGLVHEDPHPGNFLLAADKVLVIDGDGIRVSSPGLSTMRNLALLFAQLPPTTTTVYRALLDSYRTGNPTLAIDDVQLAGEIAHAREQRLTDFLAKCTRNCTRFKVTRHFGRFVAVVRDEAEFLAPILAAPDDWLGKGIPLKQGRTATLALIEKDGRKLVIKRYNIKSPGHALSRCWRPSRAWHSWVEGHRLRFLGIATPRPLALIEKRLGPLRGKAWLITEFCPGPNLLERLGSAPLPPSTELSAISAVFQQLAAARISHGDLKATNLLWEGDRISLIDLDAMRQHGSDNSFGRAWRKDCERFLANWPEDNTVRKKLEETLPAS